MGAQPDTLKSTPKVWHGVQQILAQASVAAHLATYLALLWQFFRFHRYRLRFAFPIGNSYPTDIPQKVPLNCQSSVSGFSVITWSPTMTGVPRIAFRRQPTDFAVMLPIFFP